MLEIFLLIFLSRKIGDICANKGRSGTIFKVMLVALWFLGEVTGAIIGAVIGNGSPILYLFALIGAAIGAGITFLVVSSLKPDENAVMMQSGGYGSLGLNNFNPHLPPPPNENVYNPNENVYK